MDGDAPAQLQPDDRLYPQLGDITLAEVCGTARFKRLDKQEAYYRCLQYEDRPYEWDGLFRRAGNFRIYAQHFVPHRERKPSTRYELARLIVRRFTSMVFGSERFPQIVVDGDEDAQGYVRELAKAAKFRTVMHTIRNKGGSQGSACASFAFVNGRPRVRVHNAKHITILGWEDRDELRPRAVLESYAYPRTVWDPKNRKTKVVTLYFARYWDQDIETIWDPIPEEAGRKPGWQRAAESYTVRHGYGFCPVYWVQNLPDPDDWDGDSDFEGMCDNFDGLNQLLSATSKGTVANVDPTLVIHMQPQMNTGRVRKGSENAIFSEKGAQYLELSGSSVEAALKLAGERKQEILDTVGVVLGDPDKMAAKALSAQAMRILYLPMITQADILREQYGEFMVQLLTGMLRAARMIAGGKEGELQQNADGHVQQESPTVYLPPRAVPPDEAGGETTFEERKPGDSENVTLNWPPYFPNTWEDNTNAVKATQAARGGQGPLISRKTAVENLAPIFGVDDVVQELADMDNDRAEDMAFQHEAMKDEAEIMAENEPKGGDKGDGGK